MQRGDIHLGNTGKSTVEARCRLRRPFPRSEDLERLNVRERDDMVIARLAVNRGGRVRWCRRGIDGDGVGEVAGREEGAFEDILAGSACDLNAILY